MVVFKTPSVLYCKRNTGSTGYATGLICQDGRSLTCRLRMRKLTVELAGMKEMTSKRRRVDWGGLLDRAWGDDATDQWEDSRRSRGEDPHVTDTINLGRERKDSQPSCEHYSDRDIPFDFSPLLFSQTSTPIRKETNTAEIRLESHVAQSVSCVCRAMRNCSVDITKCPIPAGYRNPPHQVESRGNTSNTILTNNCKGESCGKVNACICCGKTTPATTQDTACTCTHTYDLAPCRCTSAPHSGLCISDKGCYNSPLLFSEPCTPVHTSSHSASSTSHSDRKTKEKCTTYCGITTELLQEDRDNLNSSRRPIQCEEPLHSSLDELPESPVYVSSRPSKISQPNCISNSCSGIQVKCLLSSESVVSCPSVVTVNSPGLRSPSLVLTKCHWDGGDNIIASQSSNGALLTTPTSALLTTPTSALLTTPTSALLTTPTSASLTTPTPALLTAPTSASLTTPTTESAESALHFSNLNASTQLSTMPTSRSTSNSSNQLFSSYSWSPPEYVHWNSVLALGSNQSRAQLTFNSTPLLVSQTTPLTDKSQNLVSRDSTPSTLPGVMMEGDGKGRRLVLSPREGVSTAGDRQKENRYIYMPTSPVLKAGHPGSFL